MDTVAHRIIGIILLQINLIPPNVVMGLPFKQCYSYVKVDNIYVRGNGLTTISPSLLINLKNIKLII